MRFRDYLDARGESENAFARRSGVPQKTINRVANGTSCHVETALAIIRASQAEPAPDGATVTLEDLALRQEARVAG